MVKVFAPAPTAGANCEPEKDRLQFNVPVKVTTSAKADCSRKMELSELGA